VTVTVGESCHLALKLYDKNPLAKVVAKIYSTTGKELGQVKMFHAGDGLYLAQWGPMPDEKIVVVYDVLDPEDYADSAEMIEPSPKAQEPEVFVTGIVKKVSISKEFLKGVVYEVTHCERIWNSTES